MSAEMFQQMSDFFTSLGRFFGDKGVQEAAQRFSAEIGAVPPAAIEAGSQTKPTSMESAES